MRSATTALTVILLLAMVIAVEPSAAQPRKLRPIQLWTGTSRDNAGLKLNPRSGFIGDALAWKRIWTAWQGDPPLPNVDFAKQLVLVATVRGPNRVFANVTVDDQGDARLLVGGTKIGGPGFGYAFLQVSREGIKSVNGNPVSGAASATSAEYVKVEVLGTLNSQIFAIGGETTGIIITANNVTWELDLGQNQEWRKLAADLHQRRVVVTGELTVKRGVEIRQRTIVKVASLQAANEDAGENAYLTPNGKLTHALVLKDAQGGFAGFSGHIWTIEPDGAWRREPFLNRDVRKADREGRITPEQLAALAKHLAAHDLMGLPRQIGRNVGANPHVFTITFGQKQSSLTVRPGAPLPRPDARDAKTDPRARFVAIAQKLQQDARPRAVEN